VKNTRVRYLFVVAYLTYVETKVGKKKSMGMKTRIVPPIGEKSAMDQAAP